MIRIPINYGESSISTEAIADSSTRKERSRQRVLTALSTWETRNGRTVPRNLRPIPAPMRRGEEISSGSLSS
jgi:hypothetical protein